MYVGRQNRLLSAPLSFVLMLAGLLSFMSYGGSLCVLYMYVSCFTCCPYYMCCVVTPTLTNNYIHVTIRFIHYASYVKGSYLGHVRNKILCARVCVSVFIMVAIIPHQQIPVSLQLMSSLMMCGVATFHMTLCQ